MYKDIQEAKKLVNGQLVICKCPDWNEEGFQIATWNGEEFEYSGQPNNQFNNCVIAFLPLDEDEGWIYPSFYDGYYQSKFRTKHKKQSL